MVKFDVYLETHYVCNPEQIKIGIDDLEILSVPMSTSSPISFELNLTNQDHVFWMELTNKTKENEYRINGELIDDTYIKVTNIAIGNSMMNHLLNDNGYVEPDWQYHNDVAEWFQTHQGQVPARLQGSKYLNLKGTYYFHFSLPIETFLESKIPIHSTYASLYNAPLSGYESLEKKITTSMSKQNNKIDRKKRPD